jgi:hypothetical protein
MVHNSLYSRESRPFGLTWEKWASIWCNWQLSMPRDNHPAVDKTGSDCARNQNNKNAWFLTGTFGNSHVVERTCRIPKGKAILFPIIYKEDSFAEDLDLQHESELLNRATEFVERVIFLTTIVDDEDMADLWKYRTRSEFFDLIFPSNNVYDLEPGLTRSVCDGYWIFLNPLPLGEHRIHFTGIATMPDSDILTRQVKNDSIYAPFHEYLDRYSLFRVDVSYRILVS